MYASKIARTSGIQPGNLTIGLDRPEALVVFPACIIHACQCIHRSIFKFTDLYLDFEVG